ncbi:prepilin peptidase [Streptomyces sp. 6N223]|uniref:prepilin peptidase n=1 Tax=Streptomyces sp. 6N223 TaxID=3457412 RepID=UPI003FCF9C8E
MHPLLITAAAVYGALVGLLLARPGYRLAVEHPEADESPEAPAAAWRASCPRGHDISGSFGGWLGLARCPGCPPGQVRYGDHPARLAVPTAVCCAGLAAAVGTRPELVVWLLAAPLVVLLAAVDRAVQRLPDVLTLPLALLVIVGLGLAVPIPDAAGDFSRALWAGAVLSGSYFVLFLISPNGMGFGDVKLTISLGVALGWYGWDVVVLGVLAGMLLAAGYAVWLVVARGAGRRTAFALGPCLALGSLVALLVGGLAA